MPHTHYTTLISADNLAERLAAAPGSVLVFDCRFDLADTDLGEQAYAAGHIPGAHYLHLDRDLSGAKTGTNGRHPLPARDALVDTLKAHGLRQNQQIVAYDAQGGMYAARLWWLLRWLGHDSVAVLDGGLQAWQSEGHAVSQDTPPKSMGDFRAGAPLATVVDAQTVLANLATKDRLVIDARGRPLPRRERDDRSRRRTHSRRAQSLLQGQPDGRRALQERTRAARGVQPAARRDGAEESDPAMRLGRHRMPQRARDGNRRPARPGAVRGLVERMERGPVPPRRDGREPVSAPAAPCRVRRPPVAAHARHHITP